MKNYLKPISMTFMATVLCVSSAQAGAGDIIGGIFKKAGEVVKEVIPVRRSAPPQQQPTELNFQQKTQEYLQSGRGYFASINGVKATPLANAVLAALQSNPIEIAGVKIESQKLREIYSIRKNAIWVQTSGFASMGWTLQEMLSDKAVWHGLDPQKYLTPAVLDRIDNMAAATAPSAQELVEIEILLTQVYWNFLKDMSTGQINPADPAQNLQDFELRKVQAPTSEMVAISTLSKDYLENGIYLMAPPFNGYVMLQHALANIELVEKSVGWEQLSIALIEPGQSHPNIPVIRKRLAAFKYLGFDEMNNSNQQYDSNLVAAIKKLQKQHNLGADGRIGNGTYGVLNRDVSFFKNQIKANMEKWRFYPRGAEKFIMVDMGRQELDVIDRGSLVMSRRVIIGGEMTGTPTMADKVTSIRLAPDWTSPVSIMVKETIPKLGNKPSDYFLRTNVEVIPTNGGPALTPDQIDAVNWKQYTMQNQPPYLFREKNGEFSSLGLIKFNLTNRHSIYLHDTENRELFKQDDRYLSHGCIRVEWPFDLAAYLNPKMDKLDEKSGLSPAELATARSLNTSNPEELRQFAKNHTAVQNSRPFEVAVDQIPVYIFGTTTISYPDGSIAFGRDVYKQDERIINALNGINSSAK